eukprot:157081-Amphidinium_carterae.1
MYHHVGTVSPIGKCTDSAVSNLVMVVLSALHHDPQDLDYAPRDSGGGTASCVVPRLRSETNYDVRVRETCPALSLCTTAKEGHIPEASPMSKASALRI